MLGNRRHLHPSMDVEVPRSAQSAGVGDCSRTVERLAVEVPVAEGTPIVVPTDTVTFLLTDIEGSTALWEREPATTGEVVRATTP